MFARNNTKSIESAATKYSSPNLEHSHVIACGALRSRSCTDQSPGGAVTLTNHRISMAARDDETPSINHFGSFHAH